MSHRISPQRSETQSDELIDSRRHPHLSALLARADRPEGALPPWTLLACPALAVWAAVATWNHGVVSAVPTALTQLFAALVASLVGSWLPRRPGSLGVDASCASLIAVALAAVHTVVGSPELLSVVGPSVLLPLGFGAAALAKREPVALDEAPFSAR